MLHPWVLLNRTQSLEHHQKRTSRGLEAKGVAYSLQRKLILQLVKTSFWVSKPQDTIRPKVAWVMKFVQPDLFEVSSFEFPFNIQHWKGITMDISLSPKSHNACGPGPALIHRRLPRTMSPVCRNLSKVLRHWG